LRSAHIERKQGLPCPLIRTCFAMVAGLLWPTKGQTPG